MSDDKRRLNFPQYKGRARLLKLQEKIDQLGPPTWTPVGLLKDELRHHEKFSVGGKERARVRKKTAADKAKNILIEQQRLLANNVPERQLNKRIAAKLDLRPDYVRKVRSRQKKAAIS